MRIMPRVSCARRSFSLTPRLFTMFIFAPVRPARLALGVFGLVISIFTVLLSIQFLLMVVVGGLGSLHGALFGAVFVALLPVAISQARDSIPAWAGALAAPFGKEAGSAAFLAVDQFVKKPGLEPGLFGLILVLFILFEPLGIYGRWRKIQLYFSTFPLYKRATFRRQKSYMRSERLR